MTPIQIVLLYFSFIGVVLLLIAGGWKAIRNWIKAHAATKAQKAAAEAQALEEKAEARAQELLKKLQEEAAESGQTSTTVTGDVSPQAGSTS
ncbi:DUF1378 family protein [Mangrovibacter plantisponsor]|uniref:Uncharacterized protein DUF1378 n=1 Tax=Mangrovibacter plantisponsor TaxID=451513 RepID=A0A317PIW2_9ENTR|nr:DUF1378 family protein [Mangrovibacter plantisponsor]PWV99566.1 uncharacterized protein DUF1378 [Mangrovibacter plantisponsor]